MNAWMLGVIGGSGVYDIEGIEDGRWQAVASPWGAPSDALYRGRLHGVELAFLPRHGRGHVHAPSDINYRANIDALKRVGCTDILSLSACGSLREDLAPGSFVIVDQFIDRTFARPFSFFSKGVVAHVSMAEPICPRLAKFAADAARSAGARVIEGGTYLAMEGPQFSSRAESEVYRTWGCAVIGMTNMPEAKLAREAELPYASVAMVTDYDGWREDAAPVTVSEVVRVLNENAGKAKALVGHVARAMAEAPRTASDIDTCLDSALITPPAARDLALMDKLDAVMARVLRAAR